MGKKRNIVAKDARGIAFQVLVRVEEGAYSDLALDGAFQAVPELDSRERGLATELVYGVLRQRGAVDHILKSYCRQPLQKLELPVRTLLRLGIYQLFFLDRIPQRAAVHSTVELARRMRLERVTGLVNGILRASLREPQKVVWPDSDCDPLGHLTSKLSLPQWLAQRWLSELGEAETVALAQALLHPAPTTLRTNTLAMERDTLMAELQQTGISCRPTRFAPEGVMVEQGSLRGLPESLTAGFQLQDEASMLIAHLLLVEGKGQSDEGPAGDQRILDVCAAPGGKTTHLAALTVNETEIVAMDLHPQRLALLEQGAQRLGCQRITTQPWDMTSPCTLYEPGSFDRVLVDAPCSGLGVLRRNPESRWRRDASDVVRLAEVQGRILANAATLVAAGGRLLYSLCTTTTEESQQVVSDFLATHPDFYREDLRTLAPDHWAELFDNQGCLRTSTVHHDGMDSFFATALRRRS